MTEPTAPAPRFRSRAAVRGSFALLPDAARVPLAAPIMAELAAGAIPETDALEILTAYLLDPRGNAILALDEDRARWLDCPLFRWIGPGNAIPINDQIAALAAAPLLSGGGILSPLIGNHRFAPRSDDAIALAISMLDLPLQAGALEQLYVDPGPDAERLQLSVVQCGRVLAWSPHLLEWPIADAVVTALLALLHPRRPRPLLDAVARVLGPLAARPGPLPDRVRAAAQAGLEPVTRKKSTSFVAEVQAIRDHDVLAHYRELPAREVAAACAYILGFASPRDRDGFIDHRTSVLERPGSEDEGLLVPFIDGLVASAHVAALSELAAGLLEGESGAQQMALSLAAAIPLDPIRDLLVEHLDAPDAEQRALATAAVELLDSDDDLDIDNALALRLADPAPEVCAAATRSLLARGRRDLVGKHAAREVNPVRRAVVLAGLGELAVPVVGELVRGALADLDQVDPNVEPSDEDSTSPIVQLLGDALLCSVAGLDVACDLIAGVPDAAGLLALVAVDAERDIGVLAPPAVRARLASVSDALTDAGDPELAALGTYLLARMSAGDETIAATVSRMLTATDGYAATLIAALGELRVASADTAAALAPLLAPDQPLGGRVVAAAISGRALPAHHAAWAHVSELLELGTLARAAAWTALRDRARRA
ncbi:MAG: hypothetical protein WKG01_21410 [Kofleriaceae bacterium]